MHFKGHAERKMMARFFPFSFKKKLLNKKKLFPKKNCTDFFEKENLIKSTMLDDVTIGGHHWSTFQILTSLHPRGKLGMGLEKMEYST